MNTTPQILNPIILFLVVPLLAIAYAAYIETYGGGLGTFEIFMASSLTLVCWSTAVFVFFWEKKLLAQRLYLTIKPGQIETANGEIFYGEFSSPDHLIACSAKLAECVNAVANRQFQVSNSFAISRESAYVRIFNEGKDVSELELNAIQEAFALEFVNPVFEMLEDTDSQATREVGVKA